MSKKHAPLWWQHGYVGPSHVKPSNAAPDEVRKRTERRQCSKAVSWDSGRADAALRKFSWEGE